MKIKNIILIMIAVSALAGVISISNHASVKQKTGNLSRHEIWYCPMHPQILYDHPGRCPICGMDLVQKKEEPVRQGSSVKGYAAVTVSGPKQQLIGLKTAVAEIKPMVRSIRTYGIVSSAAELYKTQNEFIDTYVAYVNVHRDYKRINDRKDSWGIHRDIQANVLEVQDKLLKLGLSQAQIKQLEDVSWNQVARQPKLLLFSDSRNYWVMAQVFEQDYPLVHEGQQVTVNIPAYHTTTQGVIRSVGGFLDPSTRSVTSLIELTGFDSQLASNMYVDVIIPVDLGEGLWVPRQAVMDTGIRKIIFVSKAGNSFEPREVRTGNEIDDGFEIISGLKSGERFVTSGNFLLDSESRVQSGLQADTAQPGGDNG